MDMMTAVKTCFAKYVDWNGRAQRSEYWWWVLFVIIVSIVLTIIDIAVLRGQLLSSLWSLATLLPGLFVGVRRLHDLDKSGWWWLIVLVPIIGILLLLYWFVQPSQEGENRFGANPLG